LITERPIRFVFCQTVIEHVKRYIWPIQFHSKFNSNANHNTKFDLRFDLNTNGRFTDPSVWLCVCVARREREHYGASVSRSSVPGRRGDRSYYEDEEDSHTQSAYC